MNLPLFHGTGEFLEEDEGDSDFGHSGFSEYPDYPMPEDPGINGKNPSDHYGNGQEENGNTSSHGDSESEDSIRKTSESSSQHRNSASEDAQEDVQLAISRRKS